MQTLLDITATPITFLLLLGVGLELTPADFLRVRDRPWMVAAGVLLPPLLLPPLAIVLIHLVHPSPVIAAGLLLVVVCPIGGLSNAYSAVARASVALSVAMTAVSCATALATIPAATALIEWLLGHAATYSAPTRTLVAQLLLVLAPSIGAGMAIRAYWPALATRHRQRFQGVALGLLGLLAVLVIGSAVGRSEIEWPSALSLMLAFVASSFALGASVAWLLGGTPADRFTFSAEFSTRNLAVALAVAFALGGQREFVWFTAVYATVEIPLVTLAAVVFRRRPVAT